MLPEIAGRSVLVTGGCGFIGSHLVRELAALGAGRIVVIDSMRFGDPANLLEVAPTVEIHRVELGSEPSQRLKDVVGDADYVVHLAARKHNQSKDDPREVLRSNVAGSYDLFEAAGSARVRKVVFASSLYAYGRMSGLPFDEAELPRPTTVYGISKLAGEHLLFHCAERFGFRATVLRYMFVYGPRQFAGQGYRSVIVKNFERLRIGVAPVMCGDGAQALDYVFVDDVVRATIGALGDSADGEVLNVGSGRAISVRDLIDAMRAAAGCDLAPVVEPADWTAGSLRVARVERARERIGWEAKVPIGEGLAATFSWIRGQLGQRG